MYFNLKTISVYRKSQSTPTTDPTFSLIGTIVGTTVPINANDAIRNSQQFADVKQVCTVDSAYMGIVRANDELLYPDDKSYRVRFVQSYDSVLSHDEIYLGDTQWRRTAST